MCEIIVTDLLSNPKLIIAQSAKAIVYGILVKFWESFKKVEAQIEFVKRDFKAPLKTHDSQGSFDKLRMSHQGNQ